MYPEFDLRSVSRNLSKSVRLQLALINTEDDELDVKIIKCVSSKLNNDVNISINNITSDISNGRKLRVGDKVLVPYTRNDKEEVLALAKGKLEALKEQRLRLANNNDKILDLYNRGITTGALLLCKVKQLLPLGDIILECDRLPDVNIILSRDKCINEPYEIGKELYVIVSKIKVIGDKLTINVSRRSKLLVKELLYNLTFPKYESMSEICDVVRLVDEGSCVFINGQFGNYIGKSGENLKKLIRLVNNERVRFLRWDPRLPIRVINTFPSEVNVLDIYYPEETDSLEWHVVINSSDFKYVLGRNAQALKFIKLLNKVKVVLHDESYLSTEHKPYKYEGSLLSSENEIVKRFYFYRLNNSGIYDDKDFLQKYRKLRMSVSDINYLTDDFSKYYQLECPVCGEQILINDDVCPSCNYNLKVEDNVQ